MGNYIAMKKKITPETFFKTLKAFIDEHKICLDEVVFDDVEYRYDNVEPLFHMHGLAIFCYGATKGAFIPHDDCNFVFKFDFAGLDEEYCHREADIYQSAEIEGLDRYFAKTQFYDVVGHAPIFMQEYVGESCWDVGTALIKDEDIKKAKTAISKTSYDAVDELPYHWILNFIKLYGEKEFLRLCLFLEEEGINDLHEKNVGYIDGRPVLFDYSGYYEDEF